MNEAESKAFAAAWVAAWNSHDLERILQHYSEEVVLTSPFVTKVMGPDHPSITGKAALREYWGTALTTFKTLRFDLLSVHTGINSIILIYRSVNGLIAAEYMRLNASGRVCEVHAHYTSENSGAKA